MERVEPEVRVVRLQPPGLCPRRRASDRPSASPPPGSASVVRWLLARAVDGDEAAWSQLVDLHVHEVWTWAVDAAGPTDAPSVCEMVWLRLADCLSDVVDAPLHVWLQRAVVEESRRLGRGTGTPVRCRRGSTPRLVHRAAGTYSR